MKRASAATMPSPSPPPRVHSGAAMTLAADIGGTHARIGLLRTTTECARPVELLAHHTYTCAAWPGLADILVDFVHTHAPRDARITRCTLAVAGYLRGDELVAENLRWPVRLHALRERLGLRQLDIVNDFEALASATRFLALDEGIAIIAAAGKPGPSVVLGPGTGLGCAVLVPHGADTLVLPSEAGHVALAPGTPREIDVLRHLSRPRAYVHTGHLLSGPGLLNLYRALAELDGVPARLTEPTQVSAAAQRGDDALAREALSMFCALLGSFAGDLATIFKASAGVVLAGGILPSIQDFLLASDFRTRFLNKGLMRGFLAGVPVRLIEHGQLGVIGAAAMEVQTGAQRV